MKASTIILAAAVSCLPHSLVASALAASAIVPPKGATTYVTAYIGRVIDIANLGNGDSETLVEMTGVTRNTMGQSPFDNMSARCLILSSVIGGKAGAAGACSETDSDGDIVFTSFEGDAHKLIGGTGKYKGISGSTIYTLTPEPSPEPGKVAYSVKQDVAWTTK
jgi:hypothetical protein